MKKSCYFIAGLMCFFLHFGCSNLSRFPILKIQEIPVDIPEDSNKDVFLIKYNISNNYVPAENTGYVENFQRSVIDSSYSFNSAPVSSTKPSCDEIMTRDIDYLNFEVVKNQPMILKSLEDYRNITVSDNKTEPTYSVDDKKNFYYLISDEKVVSAEFTCKYVGKNCYVWFYGNGNPVIPESDFTDDRSFQTLGEKFDSISQIEQKYFGSHNQKYVYANLIDAKEKIDIIVTDLYNDAKEGQNSGILGLFVPCDTFINEKNDLPYKSNETLAIYLDSYFYLSVPKKTYSALVHEYNHLLNWINKNLTKRENKDKNMESWFTEMLSLTAEDIFQEILGIEDKDSSKSRIPTHYYASFMGFKNWASDEFGYTMNYANAYAFGAFLARNYGGAEIIKKIATNEYVNEEAVEKATGKSFEELIKNFAISFLYPSNGDNPYTQDSKIFSLHKGDDEANSDGIKISPINLTAYEKPQIFYAQKILISDKPENGNLELQKKYAMPLDGAGFSIHYLGKNVTDFKLNTTDMSSNVKYFVYIQ